MLKKITLSVEEALLQDARRRAATEKTTLNALFHVWLQHYTMQPAPEEQYLDLMTRLTHVQPGRKFSREEMNESA
jgi:hypothetical protein